MGTSCCRPGWPIPYAAWLAAISLGTGTEALAQEIAAFQVGRPAAVAGNGLIRTLQFSPDGKLLAYAGKSTGSLDPGLVHLFNVPERKEAGSIEESATSSCVFTPNSEQMIVWAGADGFSVWDVTLKQRLARHSPTKRLRGPGAVAISSDGRIVAVGCSDQIALWSLEYAGQVKRLGTLQALDKNVYWLKFSAEGRHLLAANTDLGGKAGDAGDMNATGHLKASYGDAVRVWEIHKSKADGSYVKSSVAGHFKSFRAMPMPLALSPDGRALAIIAYGHYQNGVWGQQYLKLLDTTNGRTLTTVDPSRGGLAQAFAHPKGHSSSISAVSFSSDGSKLGVVIGWSNSGPVAVLDVRDNRWRMVPDARARAEAFAFSPDGQTLATVARSANPGEYVIKLWDLRGF